MAIDAHRTPRLSILLFLLLLSVGTAAQVSRDTLSNGDTVYISNCRYNRGSIVVDTAWLSQMAANPSLGFDAWAVLNLNEVRTIVTYGVSMPAAAGNANSFYIYNDSFSGPVYAQTHSSAYGLDTIDGGVLAIHLHIAPGSDYSTPLTFSIQWTSMSLSSACSHRLSNLTVTNIGGSSALLSWVSDFDSIYVEYGNGGHLVTGDGYLMRCLDTSTEYTVRVSTWNDHHTPCCILTTTFTTGNADPPNCIDAVDLDSPFAGCTYGHADSVLNNVGRVEGRHTVMTDTTQRDPVVGAALRTIPPGHTSSVRLGNNISGAEGESIIYQMVVDTLQYDILMLKYAAVLQQPDHSPHLQPKFSFTIYDENMQPVDPLCGAADFVASPDLGWNGGGSLLWKDWTTVGIDLTPYHGQFLNIRFITRDCLGGQHFGYAYFVTECFRKGISVPHCGADASTAVTAPEGFNYYWYTDNSPDTVSTEPSVITTESDTYYHCRMSYIEDPSCWFEMKVWSGPRFPIAGFDYQIFTDDCREFDVLFLNRSAVSADGVTPLPNGEPCESTWWNFDNGQTSDEFNPIVHYDNTGTYWITQISSISGGECKDTLVRPITLPTYLSYEEHYAVCDSFTWWRTGETFYLDTVGAVDIHPAPMNCDTAYELHLKVNHSVANYIGLDSACWNRPYTWHGHTFADTNYMLRLDHLADTLRTVAGCDSLVGIQVLRYPQVPVSLEASADCHNKYYKLAGHADAPFIKWASSPPDPALDGHFSDSVLFLSPRMTTRYWLTADFAPSTLCPSSDTIVLEPVSYPTAALHLIPEYFTLDNMEYDAYDAGPPDQTRSWLMQEYLDGSVVDISIPPSDDHVHGQLSQVVDSLNVVLAVDNGYCTDTVSRTIPMIRTTVWAPNVFTPYLESNNRFQVITSGISNAELHIYNREGLLVFSTTDLGVPWDGTHNGRPCMQGAYTWRLYYVADDFPEKPQVKVGTVTLIR